MEAAYALRELLGSRESYAKEGPAWDEDGYPVSAVSPRAAIWSLGGAIVRICPPFLTIVAIEHVAGCDVRSIPNKFTHSELLGILDRAIDWLQNWE